MKQQQKKKTNPSEQHDLCTTLELEQGCKRDPANIQLLAYLGLSSLKFSLKS
jgi:hypothetical protein